MAFLDKKEQVLDVELTQYGKELLACGKFKPSFYSFFDDGVLYNHDYAGKSESQNSAEERIKDMLVMETQYIFSGAETRISKRDSAEQEQQSDYIDVMTPYPDSREYQNSLLYPLCNSSIGEKQAPYYSILAHDSPITGSEAAYTGSFVVQNIPQLFCKADYLVTKDRYLGLGALEPQDFTEDMVDERTITLSDGTILTLVGEEGFVFCVDEFNTFFEDDNFEIEMFERVPSSETGKELLIPLYFNNSPEEKQNINNYFEVTVDNQVPDYFKTRNRSNVGRIYLQNQNYFNFDREDSTPLSVYEYSYYIDEEDCE